MALATRVADAARNAAVDAITALLNAGAGAGTLRIYDGTQPADADDAITGTLLAEITLSDPAFGAASAGTATADITPALTDASANASGTATHFRAEDSNSVNVLDGSVGTSSADLILDSVAITAGQTITVTAWTITMPGS